MATIYKVFSGEVFKLKRTAIVWLIVLFPVLVTILFFCLYVDKGNDGIKIPDIGFNQWTLYAQFFLQFFSFFFPMLASLTAFSLVSIEEKNYGWKLIYTQPIHKIYYYLSKTVLLYILLFLSIAIAYVLLLVSGSVLSTMYPGLGFQEIDSINYFLFPTFVKLYIVVVSIASIHLFLALLWNNFFICVGSSSFLVIFGLIISRWKYAYLFPYTNLGFILNDFQSKAINYFPQYIWVDVLYILAFVIAGYAVVKYKQVK